MTDHLVHLWHKEATCLFDPLVLRIRDNENPRLTVQERAYQLEHLFLDLIELIAVGYGQSF